MTAAIKIIINKKYCAEIYPAGMHERIDWETEQPCSLGDNYAELKLKNEYGVCDNLAVEMGTDGKWILRLKETKRYTLKLLSPDGSPLQESFPLPKLQNEGNKSLKCEKDDNSMTFQFINYLGRSRFLFRDSDEYIRIPFEVVPDKMDYDKDYKELTRSLAESCAELLLEYSGATSSPYVLSENNAKTLLEQFIFLRQFCYSENIRGLFEAIKRNPDSVLIENDEMRPIGTGVPSRRFYSHPFSCSKNWQAYRLSDGRKSFLPSKIAVTQKTDSLDTPANRFIKFALQTFNNICESLIEALQEDKAGSQTECLIEAKQLHSLLMEILSDRFFDEVGIMSMVPSDNQVLQKREGYLQIFHAYSMIDLALQLDWDGKDSVYEGESKNTALLYEYWLFFELYHVMKSIEGCKAEKTMDAPFIKYDKRKLTISLRQGSESHQYFVIPRLGLKVNLYYNRVFSPKGFDGTKYEGSYSREFRPDYTLAVFPEFYTGKYNGEQEATKDGAVSYVHFDAKYRITKLNGIVGNQNESDKEMDEEKADEVTNVYKRGDLLKMHTYNDAIRRTSGSYVLYPGGNKNNSGEGNIFFSLYDEILPGVGAFAIKPGNKDKSEEQLKKIIMSILNEKAGFSSRLNRMRYYSEMIIREPSSKELLIDVQKIQRPNNYCDINDMIVLGNLGDNNKNEYWLGCQK